MGLILTWITDYRITDYIGINFVWKRKITDCGVVAVVVVSAGSRIGSSSRGGADYGLRGYGFVRIADWVRISRGRGLQEYGLFF